MNTLTDFSNLQIGLKYHLTFVNNFVTIAWTPSYEGIALIAPYVTIVCLAICSSK